MSMPASCDYLTITHQIPGQIRDETAHLRPLFSAAYDFRSVCTPGKGQKYHWVPMPRHHSSFVPDRALFRSSGPGKCGLTSPREDSRPRICSFWNGKTGFASELVASKRGLDRSLLTNLLSQLRRDQPKCLVTLCRLWFETPS